MKKIIFFVLFFLPSLCLSAPTVTYNIVTESSYGSAGSTLAWATAYLLNDGRIASFSTGQHAYKQATNAMRIIDVTTTPVTTYNEWDWHQTCGACDSVGDCCSYTTGTNTYLDVYDNFPDIYLPTDGTYGKIVWFGGSGGHGIFDFNPAVKSWIYGNASPSAANVDSYVRNASDFNGIFNPGVAWCSALDVGVLFGGSAGNGDECSNHLRIIERDGTGGYTWKITAYDTTGMANLGGPNRHRNESVVIGTDLYLHGPNCDGSANQFHKISLVTKAVTATLTPAPYDSDDYFPQVVYDSSRNRLVRIGVKLREYDPSNDAAGWVDITPAGWPGFGGGTWGTVRGVYHPTHNAIYFSAGRLDDTRHWEWNRIEFGVTSSTSLTTNSWIRKTSPGATTSIGQLNKHVKLAYDSSDYKVYMIGGDYTAGAAEDDNSNEMVYTYDVATSTWVNVLSYANAIGTSGYPDGKCNPGWAYDSSRNVFWMSGGQHRHYTQLSGLIRGGLWTYDPTVAANSGEVWHLEGPGLPYAYDCSPPSCVTHTPNVPDSGGEMGPWFLYYDPVNDCLWQHTQVGDSEPRYVAKYTLSGITIKNGVSKDNWTYTDVPTEVGTGPGVAHRMGAQPWAYDTKRHVFYVWSVNNDLPTDANPVSQMWKFTPYTTQTGSTPPAGTWVKLYENTSNIAPMRSQYGMAYDSNFDRVMLFAGQTGIENSGTYIDSDTAAGAYVFNPNNNTMSYLTVSGIVPDARKGEGMVYAPYNNVFVVMGGRGFADPVSVYTGDEVFLLRLGAGTTPPSAQGCTMSGTSFR